MNVVFHQHIACTSTPKSSLVSSTVPRNLSRSRSSRNIDRSQLTSAGSFRTRRASLRESEVHAEACGNLPEREIKRVKKSVTHEKAPCQGRNLSCVRVIPSIATGRDASGSLVQSLCIVAVVSLGSSVSDFSTATSHQQDQGDLRIGDPVLISQRFAKRRDP